MIRAIFPLPVFILPQGYTRLRIFETRYLDMVKESFKQDASFVLCQYDPDAKLNVPRTGCLVKIIDFDKDEQGNLLIDIKAQSIVNISDVTENKVNLRYGHITPINGPAWLHEEQQVLEKDHCLKEALENIFQQNTEIEAMYKHTEFDCLAWVTARWLELLPISIDKKQQLAYRSSFANIKTFLHTVINNELA